MIDIKTLWKENKHIYTGVAGIVTIIGGTAWGFVRSLKRVPALNENRVAREKIADVVYEDDRNSNAYHNDAHKEKLYATAKKLYWKGVLYTYVPPVAVVLAGCTLCGVSILLANNKIKEAKAAAAAAVAEYALYRARVRKAVGDEEENRIFLGLEKEEVAEVDENGEAVKKEVDVLKDIPNGAFRRVFLPPYCRGAEYNVDINKVFVNAQLTKLKREIIFKKMVTLNDAFEALGFDKTVEGEQFCWYFDPRKKISEQEGDCIDIQYSEAYVPFNGELHKALVLTFTPKGVVSVAKQIELGVLKHEDPEDISDFPGVEEAIESIEWKELKNE